MSKTQQFQVATDKITELQELYDGKKEDYEKLRELLEINSNSAKEKPEAYDKRRLADLQKISQER